MSYEDYRNEKKENGFRELGVSYKIHGNCKKSHGLITAIIFPIVGIEQRCKFGFSLNGNCFAS